ncbi:MAG: response regulator [Acidobacteriota bacterium]|nr:response regulator [Acidobacteriota bacterium]
MPSRDHKTPDALDRRIDAACALLAAARDTGLGHALSGAIAELGDATGADRAAIVLSAPAGGAPRALVTWRRDEAGPEPDSWWIRSASAVLDGMQAADRTRGRKGAGTTREPVIALPLGLGERLRGLLLLSGTSGAAAESLSARIAPSLAAAVGRSVAIRRGVLESGAAGFGIEASLIPSLNHALRTPLNGVLGMADLLSETSLTAEQQEAVSMIRASGRALLASLNDVLDIAKLAAGQVENDVTTFSLRETVYRTLKAIGERARDRGVELSCQISPDVPDALRGDQFRVQQVVAGLLGLTVDMDGESTVTLRVNVGTSEVDRALLLFAIARKGPGLPVERPPDAPDSGEIDALDADGIDAIVSTLNDGATGLSVALGRQLIIEMGGKIWAEHDREAGTVVQFTLEFEVPKAAGDATSPSGTAPLRELSVLLAVESPLIRDALVEMLQAWQMRPAMLPGAEAAAATMLRAEERGEPFGLAIVELPEGGRGGQLAAEELHEDTAPCRAPMILLHRESSRCEMLQDRWDPDGPLHLNIPVKAGELFDAILIAIKRSSSPAADTVEAASAATAPRTPLYVLIAEDHPMNRRLAVKLLERQGHRVTAVENGELAVAAVAEGGIDVVLMDLQMPVMDGIEATHAIRALERDGGRRMPIIAVTAHTLKEDRERCFAAGMDAYVAKPLDTAELISTIDRLIFRTIDRTLV